MTKSDIKNSNHQRNVIIIGGGPAGLAASIYNARAGLKPLVFAGSPPGGQLTLTSEVENYPGFEHILGPDLIQKMRDHTTKFGTEILDQNITKVDFSGSVLTVSTYEQSYMASAVLIATGAKALWLGLESETRLRGKGVSACATCDGFFFRDKVVVVVGGGDTAMEEALTLTKFASKVYLIHRRDTFRASKIMIERVKKHEKIELVLNEEIVEVMGEMKVEGVKLKSGKSLDVGGLFVAIGHKPDTDLFKGQIDLDETGYVLTYGAVADRYLEGVHKLSADELEKIRVTKPAPTATSVKGVFAAGDCVDHRYRQAATAVGMGVAGAIDVERWLEMR